jgi:hypothetical protein
LPCIAAAAAGYFGHWMPFSYFIFVPCLASGSLYAAKVNAPVDL